MTSLHPLATSTDTPAVAVTCPLCHTVRTAVMAVGGLAADDHWTCGTCGHAWSAKRLETVAEYERYVASR